MKRKGISKILVGVCLILVLAILFMSGCGPAMTYKIGLSQLLTHPSLDATREGIIDGLADNGYVEGDNLEIDYQNSELDMTLVATIAQQFVSDMVDAMITIATPNSQAAISAAEGTDIPVIFTAITDPVGSEMVVDWDNHPDENVTGVSDMLPVAENLDLILEVVPGVETIGTMYNAGESNSVYLVGKLIEACDAFDIEVVESPVATSADILAAANSLVGRGVDVIWIGTDNTVVSGLEALIGVCEDNQVPLFASDDPSMERGAIAGWGFDYYDIGYQTGEMVAKILDGDGTANDVPVEKGKIVFLSVNTAAAEIMGVTIPQSIVDEAKVVYEE
ncbi:ABC transporter substrate-binding protein [Chloroflexota bacterium]